MTLDDPDEIRRQKRLVESATMNLPDVFDRVHDGTAVIIDPQRAALAVLVMHDGAVQLRSPFPNSAVAQMLRDLADTVEKKG